MRGQRNRFYLMSEDCGQAQNGGQSTSQSRRTAFCLWLLEHHSRRRVARQTRPSVLVAVSGTGLCVPLGSHNAFHPRKGKPVERRRRKAMGLRPWGRWSPGCRRDGQVKPPSVPGCSSGKHAAQGGTSARDRGSASADYTEACPAFIYSLPIDHQSISTTAHFSMMDRSNL